MPKYSWSGWKKEGIGVLEDSNACQQWKGKKCENISELQVEFGKNEDYLRFYWVNVPVWPNLWEIIIMLNIKLSKVILCKSDKV